MTPGEWTGVAGVVVVVALPLLAYIRRQEKRVDAHDQTLYGTDRVPNGLVRDVRALESWKEDFREQYPKDLRLVEHNAVGRADGAIKAVEIRVFELEHPKR